MVKGMKLICPMTKYIEQVIFESGIRQDCNTNTNRYEHTCVKRSGKKKFIPVDIEEHVKSYRLLLLLLLLLLVMSMLAMLMVVTVRRQIFTSLW